MAALRSVTYSLYGDEIVLEIWDKGSTNTDDFDFNVEAPGWAVEYLGDKDNIFDDIIPSNCKCNMRLENEAQWQFFEQMTTAIEGRLYVKVLQEGSVLFNGKIILEDLSLDDALVPVVYFTAIDCLTDLKEIEFIPYKLVDMDVKRIFSTIFSNLSTKFLWSHGETPYWGFQSDLVPDAPEYAGNLMECLQVNHYFYKNENKRRTNFSCYDVLIELLKRLNCQCSIFGDTIFVIGKEGIHNARATQLHYYNDYNFVASSSITVSNLDLTNPALSGGRYTFLSGFKKVIIEADKKFSNRMLGDAVYWRNAFNNPILIEDYQEVGTAKADIAYRVRINFEIVVVRKIDDTLPMQPYFYMRMNLKAAGSVIVTDRDYNLPTTPGKYYYEFILEANAANRMIEAKFEMEDVTGENISDMVVDTYMTMTETPQIYDKIRTIAEIDNENVKIKTITIYGNQEYGNELVRFYLASGGNVTDTKRWKWSGAGSFDSLESIIATSQLENLGRFEILELPYNKAVSPYYFDTYSYRGKTYFPIGLVSNLHLDTTTFTLISTISQQTDAITIENEVPLAEDVNEVTSSTIGNIQLYLFTYYEEFENVTADYIEPSTGIETLFIDIDEIRASWSVYMNGVLQQYIDVALVSYPPEPGELNMYQYTYFAATNRMYFGQPLEDCFIQIKHSRA